MTRRKDNRDSGSTRDRTEQARKPRTAKKGIVETRPLFGTGLNGALIALEPRVVFDAAAVASADAAHDQAAEQQVADALQAARDGHAAGQAPSADEFAAYLEALGSVQLSESDTQEIAFIDGSVSNVLDLIASIDPSVDVVLLDPTRDGVQQIADALEGRDGIDAIHLVAHGSAAELYLGNTTLDAGAIEGDQAATLAAIGHSLSDGADLLVYGCNFGLGEAGAAASAALAAATGADVASSDDFTGSAQYGGDWDLEVQTGAIETEGFVADRWDGVLAPFNIEVTGSTVITTTTDAAGNTIGVYENVGTVGTTQLDLVATIQPGGTASIAFQSSGNDIRLVVGSGSSVVTWTAYDGSQNTLSDYQNGTQSALATGSPNITIFDLDGNGPGNPIESVTVEQNGLTSYTTNGATNLEIDVSNGLVTASGTADENSGPESAVTFSWDDVSSWTVTYTATSSGRWFVHDGNGDFSFPNENVVLVPALDLDGDDSTTTGSAYAGSFQEAGQGVVGSGAVPVVDSDVDLSQTGTSVDAATITLTNAQAGDVLLVSGLPSGISATTSTGGGGEIIVTLSGPSSPENFELALQAISFNNTSDNPSTVDRAIEIIVDAGANDTNVAMSTISVLRANDGPTAEANLESVGENQTAALTGNVITDSDATSGTDSDPEGDSLSVTAVNTQSVTAGGLAIAGSYGTLVIQQDGSYSYSLATSNPAVNGLGAGDSLTENFSYVIADPDGVSDSAALTITINGANDGAPTFSGTSDGAVAGSDGSVSEIDLAVGTQPAGTGETVSGTFFADAPDGLVSVTVGGTIIQASALQQSATTPISITTIHGTLVINGFDGASGAVSYSYTLGGAVDHGFGAVSDDIALAIEDADGETATGTLTLAITDDGPVATDDADSVAENGTGANAFASGNVVTGSGGGDTNTTDGVADLIGSDVTASPVTAIAAGVGAPSGGVGTLVAGSFGSISLSADGSYSYALDNNNPTVNGLGAGDSLTDVFTYQVTDADGSTATAMLTITINGANDGAPTIIGLGDGAITGTDGSVLESDLVTGSTPVGSGESMSGSFVIDAPDGLVSLLVETTSISAAALAASGTTPITIVTANGSVTINGFDDATGVVDYSFTLGGAVDHSAGPVAEDIALAVTDQDGETNTATLSIAISDDAPSAADDTDRVSEDAGGVDATASGNVVTGSGGGDSNSFDGVADTLGADGAATPVTAVGAGTAAPVGNVGTGVSGSYGSLVLNGDGSYVYTPNNGNPDVNALGAGDTLVDVFTYQITDGDGDVSSATLTLTIDGANDGPPSISGLGDGAVSGTDGTVSESDLADGTNAVGEGEALAGSFTVVAPDGLDSVTVGGTIIPAADLVASGTTPITISTTYGSIVIDGFDGTTGVVSYTFTLAEDVDHGGGPVSETIALVVTDTDGESSNTALTIAIADDAPQANSDTDSVSEDGSGFNSVATGNVVTGVGGTDSNTSDGVADFIGADEDSTPVSAVGAGSGVPTGAPGAGIAGSFGTLTMGASGTYVYVPDNNNPTVNALGDGDTLTDVFTYQITDGDGSTDTATLTITINGANDGVPSFGGLTDGSVSGTDGSVVESDLASGSSPAGDGETLSGDFTVVAPDGLQSLTVESTSISASALAASGASPITILTDNGSIVIEGYDASTGLVSYNYTLGGAVDHASGPVSEAITLVATDADGETTNAQLTIAITDDAPSANADVDSVTENATGNNAFASGNLITGSGGSDINSTDGVADETGADAVGISVVGVAAGSVGSPTGAVGVSVPGTFGALTVNASGDYSYALDNGNATVNALGAGDTLTETFSYQIEDGDGDRATATLTLTIQGANDGPPVFDGLNDGSVDGTDGSVDEAALSSGSNSASNTETVSGTFTASAPDGLAAISVAGTSISASQLANSASAPVFITTSNGTIIIEGFNALTGAVSYSFTLGAAFDHSGGSVQEDIALTITDSDGEVGTGTLSIDITDDAPLAADDADSAFEDGAGASGFASGNVVTGVEGSGDLNLTDGIADIVGADGVGSAAVTAIGAGTGVPSDVPGSAIAGAFGSLTINAAGAYIYLPDNANPTVNAMGAGDTLTDVFTYQLTDGDGSTNTASITITIIGADDGPPQINGLGDGAIAGTDGSVQESDLSGGTTPAGPDETVGGSFSVVAPDGLQSLQVNGTIISNAALVDTGSIPVVVATAYGAITINGFDAGSGAVSYSYTLASDVDHSSGAVTDDIALTLTDADGQTVSETLAISVEDDVPVTADDTDRVLEDGSGVDAVASGNVITGAGGSDSNSLDGNADTVGADATSTPVVGVAPGSIAATGSVGVAVAGAYGSLTLNGDGSYVYVPDGGNATVNALGSGETLTDTFSYTVQDSDGSTQSATLTITIDGSNDGPPTLSGLADGAVAGTDGSVEESDLASGSTPAGMSETVSGTFAVSAPDGLQSISVGGTAISESALLSATSIPISVATAHGVITIDGYIPSTGTVSYSFTLTSHADHSGGSVAEVIALTVTDADGEVGSGTLALAIGDDAPTAVDDADSVVEDGSGFDSVATGNVVTGAEGSGDANATDGVADVTGADSSGRAVTGVAAGIGVPSGGVGSAVAGSFGSLVVSTTGAYIYTPDNANPAVNALGTGDSLTDVFTYALSDGDGSTDTATITITINGVDDGSPEINGLGDGVVAGTDGSVEESDLAGGSTPSGSGELTNGTFSISTPDGFDGLVIGGVSFDESDLVATNGTPVAITTAFGTLTVSGFNAGTGVISYAYALSGPASHLSGPVTDSVSLALTDGDGQITSSSLSFAILDDAPVVSGESDTVLEDGIGADANATGNVLTGAETSGDSNLSDGVADVIGADAAGAEVTGVVSGSGAPSGGVATPLAGLYGSLTLQANGDYVYTPDNGDPAVNALGLGDTLTETFTYAVTDGDGDEALATLTIIISGANDGPPEITGLNDGSVSGTDALVEESDLAGGTTPLENGEVATGSFTIAAPDGLQSVSVGGTLLSPAQLDQAASSPIAITTLNGVLTITDFDDATGEVTYQFDLGMPIKHVITPVQLDIALEVRDADGETTTGMLSIAVEDDAPIANDDTDLLTEIAAGSFGQATGNVVSGTEGAGGDANLTDGIADTLGADATARPVSGFDAGVIVSGGLAGAPGTAVVGAFGTLQINADGSYTYLPDQTNPAVAGIGAGEALSDIFTYEVTDSDGSSSRATLEITIEGRNDAPVIIDPGNPGASPTTLPPQTGIDGSAVDPVTVTDFFSDADINDVLSITVDASALPPGLTFAGGVISGSLDTNASQGASPGQATGVYVVGVTVDDGNGGVVTTSITYTISNPLPVAQNDSFSVAEDAMLTGDVAGNDGDPDGDTLIYGVVTGPEHGSLIFNNDGSFSYQPDPNYNGADSFIYQVLDADGGASTATVSLTIDPVNDTPVNNASTVVNADGDDVSFETAGNFSSADGALSYSATGLPAGVTINVATGVISGSLVSGASGLGPASDGVYAVVVRADNGTGVPAEHAITWTVVNPAPDGVTDSFTTVEDTNLLGDVSGNDNDPDGDPVSFAISIAPTHGTLLFNGDGSFVYQPDAGFTGADRFTYQIVDSQGATDYATVSISVVASTDSPIVSRPIDDQSSFDGSTVNINVSGNFQEPDGQILSFAATGLPAGLSIDATTGVISGTIANDASAFGPYVVVVTATDIDGNQISDPFIFAVDNPGPTAMDDSVSGTEDSPINGSVAGNDGDDDGDALSYAVVSQPAFGSVVMNGDGSFTLMPDADFTGTDSFVYAVTDAQGDVAQATVTVTVAPVNDAPSIVAVLDDVTGADSEPVSIETHQAFADLDDDTLSYSASGLPAGLSIDPATGQIRGVLDGSASQGGPGGDGLYSVTVVAQDASGASASAAFVLTAENIDPVAETDSFVAFSNSSFANSVATNDADSDGDTLTFSVVSPTVNGTLLMNTDGSFTYQPEPGFEGSDTFQYQIDDGEGGVDIALATIDVTDTPSLPVVVTPIAAQSDADSSIGILDVSRNFADPDGQALTFTATGLPGGFSISPNSGVITGIFSSDASQGGPFNDGIYTITVTAADPDGNAVSDTFDWLATNPSPVVNGETFVTMEDVPVSDTLVAGDSDPDGDALSYSLASGPSFGSVTVNSDGSFVYTPDPDANGTDRFDYVVTDGQGGSAVATAVISIIPVADPPTSGDEAVATEGSPVSVDVADLFDDPDGDAIVFSANGLPDGLTINPTTGVISGTPANDASQGGDSGDGVYTVLVSGDDGNGGVSTHPITITVGNPPPIAVPDTFETDRFTPITGTVAGNDTDPDADALTYSLAAGPQNGALTFNADGSFSYTPADGFVGSDQFSYAVTDAQGASSTTVVSLTINDVNLPPSLDTPIANQGNDDAETVSLGVAGNFSHANGDDLVFTANGLPDGLSIDPVSGVIYGVLGSDASVNGPSGDGIYTVTVTATDPDGQAVSSVFTWSVSNVPLSAAGESFTTDEDTPLTGSVAGNEFDPDGDRLTYVLVGDAAAGSVTLNSDGSFIYMPDQNSFGPDSFTYFVSDGQGSTETVTASIDVLPVNDPPVVVRPIIDQPLVEGQEYTISTFDNFVDPDGDTLTFSASGLPNGFSIDPDTGVITGTMPDGAVEDGPLVITVSVDDGNGGTTSTTFEFFDIPFLFDQVDVTPDFDLPDEAPYLDRLDGIIIDTVNSIDALNGISGQSLHPVIETLGPSRLAAMADRSDGVFGSAFALPHGALEGSSLRTPVEGTHGLDGSGGALIVDTLVRDRFIYVEIANTLDADRDGQIISYDIAVRGYASVPDWVKNADQGLILIERPAGVERVTLEIVARQANGRSIDHVVTIDGPSGVVSRGAGALTFEQQIEDERRGDNPAKALENLRKPFK